jgi:predicted Zn-dependent protease
MKRAVFSFPLLSPLLGVVLLVAFHSPLAVTTAPALTGVRHMDDSSGSIAGVIAIDEANRNVPGDDEREALRRRVRDRQAGTYIDDILHERDSSLARWADRKGVPLTVWIQPTSNVADFTPEYVDQVKLAFEEWGALDLPIHFAFVQDSAAAEVHVNWIDRFNQPISGRTRWARDDDWVITDANIILAMHHHQGETLDEDATRAMALHEIGHLLGLDHTKDSLAIMAPKVRIRQLSDADRATVKLLYALPAGPLR